MTQALHQQLLNIVLINKHDAINFRDENFLKKIHNRNRLIELFKSTIEEIEANVPYWLKYFHGNWSEVKPSKIGAIVQEQIKINDLKKKLDEIDSKKNSYYKDTAAAVRELNDKIREEKKKCKETPECAKMLQCHLTTCTHGCTQYHLAYECQFNDNGRCGHYYDIKYTDEKLEHFDYYSNEYEYEYDEIEYEYKKAIRIQQLGSYDAYEKELKNDDYYDL